MKRLLPKPGFRVALLAVATVAATGALVVLLGPARASGPAPSPASSARAPVSLPLAPERDTTAAIAAPAAGSPAARDVAPSAPPLGIPPERWAEARRRVQERADNLSAYRRTLADPAYAQHASGSSGEAQKLALRLDLAPETARELEEIFAAERAAVVERRVRAERERLEREARLLAEDREGYAGYLALEAMLGAGAALSDEQATLHRRIQNILTPALADADAPEAAVEWHENPRVLAAVTRRLSPEQGAGLAAYVAEQQARARATRDLHVRMRATRIAEQLGLSQADEAVLHDYLRESPEATHADLAALLPAGLRPLLPAGM